MIVADTSVWIDFFRGNERIVKKMNELLDEDQIALAIPVRIEILSGAPKKQKDSLSRVLSALPTFYPNEETWTSLEAWIGEGLSKGAHFGAMDLLIAALAQENGAKLWSLDHDFTRMEHFGWIDLFRDPSTKRSGPTGEAERS